MIYDNDFPWKIENLLVDRHLNWIYLPVNHNAFWPLEKMFLLSVIYIKIPKNTE